MAEPQKKPQNSPMPMLLWGIASLAVAGAIAGGLMLTGGPQTERMRRMDERRASDLQQIKSALLNKFQANHTLPEKLSALENMEDYIQDPVSGKPYLYRKTGRDRFRLCATFALDSREQNANEYMPYQNFNQHPAGFYCFNLHYGPNQDNSPDRTPTFNPD